MAIMQKPAVNDLAAFDPWKPSIVVEVDCPGGESRHVSVNRNPQYTAINLTYREFLAALRVGLGLPEDHEVVGFEKTRLPMVPGVVVAIEGPAGMIAAGGGSPMYFAPSIDAFRATIEDLRKRAAEYWLQQSVIQKARGEE